jgi:hypothetical protein
MVFMTGTYNSSVGPVGEGKRGVIVKGPRTNVGITCELKYVIHIGLIGTPNELGF